MKRRWKHIADTKRTRGSDANKIDTIQQLLLMKNYPTLQGTSLVGRLPDLTTKFYNQPIVIELDGSIHGSGDEASESKQTEKRNMDYTKKDIPFITINEEWCKMYGYKFADVAHIGLFIIEQMQRARFKLGKGVNKTW